MGDRVPRIGRNRGLVSINRRAGPALFQEQIPEIGKRRRIVRDALQGRGKVTPRVVQAVHARARDAALVEQERAFER